MQDARSEKNMLMFRDNGFSYFTRVDLGEEQTPEKPDKTVLDQNADQEAVDEQTKAVPSN